MSPGTLSCLVETLRQYRLLTGPQLEAVQSDLSHLGDLRELGAELLKRGWLTAYQLSQVQQGRAAQLLLEPYIVLERLGEGGTGQVFKARHLHMQRIAAIKVIRKELLSDTETLQRFYREIEVASQVSHPNVVHAYDAGPVGANHMLVMEYIEGVDLQRRVKESGPLPPPLACDYVRQTALGLQHVHERGLVHRDIKPSNLLVAEIVGSPVGVVKILDLGLARLLPSNARQTRNQLTQLGTGMMGTPDYMAPEQAIDLSSVDIRADIYSLGCTWFYLVTGQPPFPGGTLAQKLMRHQQAPIPSLRQAWPDLPPSLDAIFRRMLAKDPNERYAAPDEVAQALGEIVRCRRVTEGSGDTHAGQSRKTALPTPQTAAPPVSALAGQRRSRRRMLRLIGLGAMVLSGLAGAILLLPEPSQPTEADLGESSTPSKSEPVTAIQNEPIKLGKWFYIGPFENVAEKGYGTAYPPEKDIDLTKKYAGKNGQECVWRAGPFADGKVNNLALFKAENNEHAVCYVYREIECAAPMELPISLGSDDTLTVWLNGEKLVDANVKRGAAPDQHLIPLKLRKGTNHLLLKICNFTGRWEFYFAIKKKDVVVPASGAKH